MRCVQSVTSIFGVVKSASEQKPSQRTGGSWSCMCTARGTERQQESGFYQDGATGPGATNLRGCNQQFVAPQRNIQMSTATSIEQIGGITH